MTLRNTGRTGHAAFDAVGLLGCQLIQKGLDYFARTHHSNQDTHGCLVPNDLRQASVVVVVVQR